MLLFGRMTTTARTALLPRFAGWLVAAWLRLRTWNRARIRARRAAAAERAAGAALAAGDDALLRWERVFCARAHAHDRVVMCASAAMHRALAETAATARASFRDLHMHVDTTCAHADALLAHVRASAAACRVGIGVGVHDLFSKTHQVDVCGFADAGVADIACKMRRHAERLDDIAHVAAAAAAETRAFNRALDRTLSSIRRGTRRNQSAISGRNVLTVRTLRPHEIGATAIA